LNEATTDDKSSLQTDEDGGSRVDTKEPSGDGHETGPRTERKGGVGERRDARERSKSGNHSQSSPGNQPGGRSSATGSGRAFISYIETHPEDDKPEYDPDGLTREARMALEAKAIDLVLSNEPDLRRTEANNPGFDLYEAGGHGRPVRWIEVKAMTGSLEDRPVCMSRVQFDCAWMNGEAYWLYVVEYADEPGQARILKISDPAGRAKNFSFDRGWKLVAEAAAHETAAGVAEGPRENLRS